MRGTDERSGSLFSYVDLGARVPQNHPLRAIRELTNATLAEMSGDFEALYARTGRPGIAPEKLLRALLLQAFYSIRSERQLMEQLEFNLLSRWFVGLGVDERVWDATVFTKNRERLLAGEVASRFLARLVGLAAVRRLLSREHFSVGLADPVTDRLSGRLELPSQLLRRAARANQLDHLLPEPGWIGRTRHRHRGLLSPN